MSGPLLERQFNQIIKFLSATNEATNEASCSSKKRKINISSDNEIEVKIDKKHSLDIKVSPSVENFQQDYYLKNIPVIIDKQMSHWPAIEKWNVDYIRKIAGKRTVPIEIGTFLC
jgi:lysine-specific demethylase 8